MFLSDDEIKRIISGCAALDSMHYAYIDLNGARQERAWGDVVYTLANEVQYLRKAVDGLAGSSVNGPSTGVLDVLRSYVARAAATDDPDRDGLIKELLRLLDEAKAKARNCDVGSLPDMHVRFGRFCNGRSCTGCPLNDRARTEYGTNCMVAWLLYRYAPIGADRMEQQGAV